MGQMRPQHDLPPLSGFVGKACLGCSIFFLGCSSYLVLFKSVWDQVWSWKAIQWSLFGQPKSLLYSDFCAVTSKSRSLLEIFSPQPKPTSKSNTVPLENVTPLIHHREWNLSVCVCLKERADRRELLLFVVLSCLLCELWSFTYTWDKRVYKVENKCCSLWALCCLGWDKADVGFVIIFNLIWHWGIYLLYRKSPFFKPKVLVKIPVVIQKFCTKSFFE